MAPPSQMSSQELTDALTNLIHNNSKSWDATTLEIVEKRLQTAAALVRGARNHLQPINRLPPEILAAIFKETQQHLPSFLPLPPSQGPFHLDWLRLLVVCRHWKGVGTTYHALWSNIDNAYVPSMCLKRSADTPLTVTIGVRNQFPVADQDQLTAIMANNHRIREFHFDPWRLRSDQQPHSHLLVPAPELVSLTLLSNENMGWNNGWGVPSPPPTNLPSLFDGQMPRLRELCLEYYTSWPDGYFHNLTRLCLYRQSYINRTSTSQFLDFLEKSPNLETLILILAGPTLPLTDDVPAVDPDRIVHLERLREVEIGCVRSIHFVTRLLEHLQLLPHTALYIWGDDTMLDVHQDLGSLFPESHEHLLNLQNIKEFRFIQETTRRHRSRNSITHLVSVVDDVLVVMGEYSVTHINLMAKRFPLLGATTASFEDAHNRMGNAVVESHIADTWRTTFEYMPSLDTLILRGQSLSTTESILSSLFPSPDHDGPAVLCPHLRTIRLESVMQDVPAFYIAILAEERASFAAPVDKLQIARVKQYHRSRSHSSSSAMIVPPPVIAASVDDDSERERDQATVLDEDEMIDSVTEMAAEYAQRIKVMRRQIKDVSFSTVRKHPSRLPDAWPTQGHRWNKACDARRGIIASPW